MGKVAPMPGRSRADMMNQTRECVLDLVMGSQGELQK